MTKQKPESGAPSALYQTATNQYARWFCAVVSPNTFGSFEYGDTYVREVRQYARLVAATTEWLQAYYPTDAVHMRATVPTPTEFIAANPLP